MRPQEAAGLIVVIAALGVVVLAALVAAAWMAHVAGSPAL